MRFSTLLLLVGLLLSFTGANAAGLALSERDCIDILERWAADPSSVPQHLVDKCRKMQGAGTAPAAGSPVPDIKPAAGIAAADPCSGPDAANSIHCWGSWESFAPAAGGVAPVAFASIGTPTVCPDLSEACTVTIAQIEELPDGGCSPGSPCGFTTIVPGTSEPSTGDPTVIVPFDLASDGSQFMVDPGGSNELISINNLTPFTSSQPNRFEGTADGIEDKFIALTKRDAQGNIVQANGIWKHTDLVSPNSNITNSGNAVWGVTSTQSTLDSLNNVGEGISASFAGRMTGDLATAANIVVNFGTQPVWTGNWSNSVRNFQFDAGGNVTGVNLVSDPTQFSANVQGSSSIVQGALLGERGDLSVLHEIDVNLISGENIKGVGVLQQR
jgi:hypothetical protein